MENQTEIKEKDGFTNWLNFIASRLEEKPDTDEFDRRVEILRKSLNISDDNNN